MSLRRPRFQDEEPADAINISPLIDVIFILLIFFIVTMVFADGNALDLDIPEAESASETETALTVSIRDDSSVWVDGQRYAASNLAAALRSKISASKAVVLRADEKVSVKTLVEVMDSVKAVGAKEIFVAAKKKQ